MTEEKKSRVTRIGDRRQSLVAQGVAAAILKDQPTMGGNQGDFQRPPCGTCLSWRRDSRAGQGGVPLGAGQCMFGPPTPVPIMDESGQRMLATMMVRPPIAADAEGCDQHDDGTDDEEGEGVPAAEPSKLLAAG